MHDAHDARQCTLHCTLGSSTCTWNTTSRVARIHIQTHRPLALSNTPAFSKDPFPKPCYLFALVAGNLAMKADSFTTASGKEVTLRIFTQPQYIDQVGERRRHTRVT